MTAQELSALDEFAFAFHRSESGHWIDGTEPYRYQVWKLRLSRSRGIEQRLDCEFCARSDDAY